MKKIQVFKVAFKGKNILQREKSLWNQIILCLVYDSIRQSLLIWFSQ